MRAVWLVVLVGCASSYQSAHTLAPGKTQVTVGLGGVKPADDDGHVLVGDLEVRHGLSDKIDGGVKVTRTPGGPDTLSAFRGDIKLQINEPGRKEAVSFALPVSGIWAESNGDYGDGLLALSPTLLVSTQVTPTVEVVFAPSVTWLLPEGSTDNSEIELAATLGVRFTDPARTWAIHPEIGLTRFSADEDSITFLTFGVGVSVGN